MRTFTIILFLILTFRLNAQNRSLDSVTKVLEEVYRTDQAPREALDSIGKKYGYVSEEMKNHWKNIHMSDSVNLSIVSAVIDKYGWLSEMETSQKANEVLFLVIQHSDPATQLRYLPFLKAAVKSGKASAKNQAYLMDRIRTNQGKFQIYGTQFQGDANGKMSLYPIEDEPNVNKRRKKVGLDPLEVYAKQMDLIYKVPSRDNYKNKIVIYGILADIDQKPLVNAEIYLGTTQLLTHSNKDGSYMIIINKSDKSKGLTFKKDGYRVTAFALDEPKEVYTFTYLLSRQ